MTESEELKFIKDVIKTLSDADMTGDLLLNMDGNNNVSFAIICSDIFIPACADAESLTVENLPILKKCIEVEKKINGVEGIYAGILFCSTIRNVKPHNGYLVRHPEYNNLSTQNVREITINKILEKK